MKQKYPPADVIAVDVDGTLHVSGIPNEEVIAWCRRRKVEGYSLMLWSARGEAHAKEAAELFGVTDVFDHIVSKPGYILDDRGWDWINFTRVIRHLND